MWVALWIGFETEAIVLIRIRRHKLERLLAASGVWYSSWAETAPTFVGVLHGTPDRVWSVRRISLNIVRYLNQQEAFYDAQHMAT